METTLVNRLISNCAELETKLLKFVEQYNEVLSPYLGGQLTQINNQPMFGRWSATVRPNAPSGLHLTADTAEIPAILHPVVDAFVKLKAAVHHSRLALEHIVVADAAVEVSKQVGVPLHKREMSPNFVPSIPTPKKRKSRSRKVTE